MNNNDKIAIGIVSLLLIIATINFFINQKVISQFDGLTTGTIIKYYGLGMSSYEIIYSYKVENIEYKGKLGVNRNFKCNDEIRGCIGEKFKVQYLKSNPKKSRINLGKYKKFQTTVDL